LCGCKLTNLAKYQKIFLERLIFDTEFTNVSSLEGMELVEPMLKQPFNLYSSGINLAAEERVNLAQDHLVLYQKGVSCELRDTIEVMESRAEFYASRCTKYIHKNIISKEKLHEANLRIKHEVEHGEREKAKAVAETKAYYEEKIKDSVGL